MSTTWGRAPLEGPEYIREHLRITHSVNWGLVILRCTYASQSQWDQFMSINKELAHEFVEDDPDVEEAMAWTVIEDVERLDNKSPEEALPVFREWLETGGGHQEREEIQRRREELFERGDWRPQPRTTYPNLVSVGAIPRHKYFIHVDQEALESVLNDGQPLQWGKTVAWVNVVNYDLYQGNGSRRQPDPTDENHDEVEPEDEEERWWTRVDIQRFYLGRYQRLTREYFWYNFTRTPPELATD